MTRRTFGKGIRSLGATMNAPFAHYANERKRSVAPIASDTREVVDILGSVDFDRQTAALAETLQRPVDQIRQEANSYLREMSATHNEQVTEWWQRFGGWMLRGYDRLLDEEGLASLRALDGEHSLIFLISHRSYLDEWAVPPALVDFGIDPPFGLAGANLNFFPLGTVARRTGIVHIRRATQDVPVYKFALRYFMGHLVSSHSNLVWSIEGGRSRTGKLRPPRHGLLRYVVDAVEHMDTSEVLLVPVSIVYDQLPDHEVQLMTAEARGQGKTPEDAKWFIGYLRGLRHRLGRVYVDFGEPMPLRARLAELSDEDPDGKNAVERIALEVSHRINVATPVTPTAAVCIALLAADRALTLEGILATVEPLAKYLRDRQWPTAGAANLTDKATIRRALQDLVGSGVLTSFTGKATLWGVGPNQHLVAAVYRNNAIHTLVLRAIAELVIVSVADEHVETAGDGWDEALRLRDLLKFEFFFAGREQFGKDLQFELKLIDENAAIDYADLKPEQAQSLYEGMDPLVAHLVIRPFVDAYAVVADQLLELGDVGKVDEKRFIDRCLMIGQQWAMQRIIASEESASAEMFQTALLLARHRGLVESEEPELRARRQEFVDEIDGIRKRIKKISRQGGRAVQSRSD